MENLPWEGFHALPTVRPEAGADLQDAVRSAASAQKALFPLGGGTKLGLGAIPSKSGIRVDLKGLNQVVDFPARDMTITVEAGMTIARLQEIAAAERLGLPIDVPHPTQATVGGILAANTSGSRRFGAGTLRDYLLGFSAVQNEGQLFKAGGRVVKNVAGYDLSKLLVGSLGSLALLSQATFKLRPLPEEQAILTIETETAHLGSRLDLLHASRTRPVVLDVYHHGALDPFLREAGLNNMNSPWVILLGLEGNGEAVHWQINQLIHELGPEVNLQAQVGAPSQAMWRALADFPGLSQAHLTLKASVLPSRVADFLVRAENTVPLLAAHAGNGIVLGHCTADLETQQATEIVRNWRSWAGESGRAVVVQKAPSACRTPDFVWGPPGGTFELMRRIKQKFDPGNLFNPGRLVGGL